MTEKPQEKALTAFERLIAAAAELTQQERDKLTLAGCVIPVVSKNGLAGANVWGYRCKSCSGIAVEFVGDAFSDGQGGTLNKPPLSLPIDQIPWTQPLLMPTQINRARPFCQCCMQPLSLHGRYLILKHIVNIAAYHDSRDKAYQQMREARMNRGGRNSETMTLPEGARVSTSYDLDDQALLEGKALDKQTNQRTPEQVAAINELADRTGLIDFLAKPSKGGRK